jgi:hypothetical protein
MNARKLLLNAKYALIKIHTILELADQLNDNGIELNEIEVEAMYEAIRNGLGGEDV